LGSPLVEAQSVQTQQGGRGQVVLFWSGIALLLVLLGLVILPTLNLGLVGDDFFLLVPDKGLQLTQSEDQLHRPLRNVILRIAGSELGIQQVLPYRLLVAGSFVASLVLLFRLTRRLGASRLGALAGVFFLAFFPRNQEVLFWFAAWQDLVAAFAVLLACVFFLDFRESGRSYSLGVAAIAYLIALGFKETTVVLPVLLVSLDFYRESISSFSKRQFWKAYIPLVCILLIYVVYFFSDSGWASLAGRRTGGYYGFRGFERAFAGTVRALINIALPFSISVGVKDIRLWHVVVVLFELGAGLLLAWRLRLWSALILTASWLVCTILPTATFSTAFGSQDRYLFVPTLGAAVFVSLLVHALAVSRKGTTYFILACVGLALYTSVGISKLAISREQWRKEGKDGAMVIEETMRHGSTLAAGGEVDVINTKFGNGLSEALHANGFSPSVRILQNAAAPGLEQERLVTGLRRCTNPPLDSASNRAILMEAGGQILKLDVRCASSLVDSDRVQRPKAWDLIYSGH
jgi:hypothetical protein